MSRFLSNQTLFLYRNRIAAFCRHSGRLVVWVTAVLILCSVDAPAQGRPAQGRFKREVDTAYVRTYTRRLIGRVYVSQKYNNLDLTAPGEAPRLRYRPNTSLNLGVGATYDAFTINVAYPFPFLNKDHDKGKTRFLDLQSHVYARKWVIDGFGQFYTGYYLHPRGLSSADSTTYYQRPDIRVGLLGIAAYYLFNHRRFSYRAAFVQNEWQKRSAGTWLIGGEVYYGTFRGDSSLVPGRVASLYSEQVINRVRFLRLGPGAGYAYTYVFREHFFATASLTVGLNATFRWEVLESGQVVDANLSPTLLSRLVIGYNSRRCNINASWVNGSLTTANSSSRYGYVIQTGNYRFTVAWRFIAGSQLRKLTKLKERLSLAPSRPPAWGQALWYRFME